MPAGVLTALPRALDQVTLVAVTDIAVAATARALVQCQQGLRFAQVLWLGAVPPPPGTAAEWRQIAPLGSRAAYSRFMLHELVHHVQTSHALCVQWDGHVLHPERWDPAFLDHDYIGAPWPQFADGHTVGNGGFSLRSKRLLEACATLPVSDEPEDIAICRTHRARFEAEFGLRFASEDVARRFAFERTRPSGGEFGFHGAFNLPGLMPARELAELLRALEPELLNRREHRDLLRHALRRGQPGVAWAVWQRMRHPRARRF